MLEKHLQRIIGYAAPKMKYNVPIALRLVENNHRLSF